MAIILNKVTAASEPNAPSGSVDLFADSADGLMKTKDSSGNVTALLSGSAIASTLKPKDIYGTVYVDAANTNGWSGADAGAWINSAYAYIHTTYTDNNGGVIELAPGSYTYSTPIVLANAGLMSIVMRGAGDGNGGTILNYTPATATNAISVGGGSGNDGGVQLEDFTVTGSAQGNGATAIQVGVTGTAGSSGATIKNVSIRRFTTGINWATGGLAYGTNVINCKVQQCTNGAHPQGENNVFLGGLLGGNATGLLMDGGGSEVQAFGVAFDDNTTQALNISASLARITMSGCRFENAGLGTDLYITQTNGSVTILGGAMQSDITTGTSTGFGNLSGGNFTLRDTWLLGQGSRVFTQAFNVSGSVIARITPSISLASVGITTIMQTGFTDRGVLNNLATTVSVPVTTETLVMNARVPANATAAGQVYRFKAVAVLAGADVCTWRIRNGAAGTVADATIADIVVTAAGFLNGRSTYEGTFTVRTIGGSGTAEAEGIATTSTAANAAAVAQTTAAAATTTAVATNAAWFIDITLATTIAGATAVQAVVEAVV